MRDREHKIQKSIFQYYLKANLERYFFMFAVPNGGHRFIGVARKLAAEGVRKGVSDLVCVLPNGKTWFVEVKVPVEMKISEKTGKLIQSSPAGEQSPEQKDFQEKVNNLSHEYSIVQSVLEFKNLVDSWKIK